MPSEAKPSYVAPLLRKRKDEDNGTPSTMTGFLACFVWIHTWIFFPFIGAGLSWLRFGILGPICFWVGLGYLAPSLKQSNRLRVFTQAMQYWVNGTEIVGPGAASGALAFSQSCGFSKKPSLQCHHPHGIVAINPCSKGGLDVRVRAVVAPLCFRLPLCRQLMELMGAVSSEKAAFKKHMAAGQDFAVIPGGVEEVVLADPDHERLYLRKRKGFVKYALEMGYDLIPVYHLGETQLFRLTWPCNTPWVVRWRLRIAEKTQVALGLGLGWAFLPTMPRRDQRCITVVGDRLELPTIERPTPEDVDKYHALYVERLQELYKSHRDLLPAYAGKELEIW